MGPQLILGVGHVEKTERPLDEVMCSSNASCTRQTPVARGLNGALMGVKKHVSNVR